jgi:hypothetical protein
MEETIEIKCYQAIYHVEEVEMRGRIGKSVWVEKIERLLD